MTSAELATCRRKLLAAQERLAGDVSYLADEALQAGEAAGGNLSHVPIHLADLGTDSFERDMAMSLLENKEGTLEEIAAALGRIGQGTFGRCEGCRKTIPKARLHALPYARYCVQCAENSSQAG